MFDRIVIENFKSLRRVDLKLGALNVFIGTNASGKSNFFDALRVLQGIGYGFNIAEILDGKPKGAGNDVWDGIRGGSALALSRNAQPSDQVRLRVEGRAGGFTWKYSLALEPTSARVASESLDAELQGAKFPAFETENGGVAEGGRRHRVNFGATIEGLGHIASAVYPTSVPVIFQAASDLGALSVKPNASTIGDVLSAFANVQPLDPTTQNLRSYSSVHDIRRLGERGENFAGLVRSICRDPKLKAAYLGWLKELRPHEVDDVGTLSGAVGEPLFKLSEGGRDYPATVLSDGTLRFAALAAAMFQPDMPGLMTIEEIENGIHPSRLRLLMELLRSRAANGHTQLMVTTHSPVVLAWLKPEEYATTFLCQRDAETGESSITPLSEVPHFAEVIRTQSIAELFTEGWMEAVT